MLKYSDLDVCDTDNIRLFERAAKEINVPIESLCCVNSEDDSQEDMEKAKAQRGSWSLNSEGVEAVFFVPVMDKRLVSLAQVAFELNDMDYVLVNHVGGKLLLSGHGVEPLEGAAMAVAGTIDADGKIELRWLDSLDLGVVGEVYGNNYFDDLYGKEGCLDTVNRLKKQFRSVEEWLAF